MVFDLLPSAAVLFVWFLCIGSLLLLKSIWDDLGRRSYDYREKIKHASAMEWFGLSFVFFGFILLLILSLNITEFAINGGFITK